jgi:hypothetical protein
MAARRTSMMLLDFRDIEPWSYVELKDSLHSCSKLLTQSAFLGAQVFQIDDANFSGDYPILGFARELNTIAQNLKHKGQSGIYFDWELEKPSRTYFSLTNGHVLVEEVGWPTQETLCSATMELDEFVLEATKYLDRVFNHCCKLVPELRHNMEVQDWLNDFDRPEPVRQ